MSEDLDVVHGDDKGQPNGQAMLVLHEKIGTIIKARLAHEPRAWKPAGDFDMQIEGYARCLAELAKMGKELDIW